MSIHQSNCSAILISSSGQKFNFTVLCGVRLHHCYISTCYLYHTSFTQSKKKALFVTMHFKRGLSNQSTLCEIHSYPKFLTRQ